MLSIGFDATALQLRTIIDPVAGSCEPAL